MGEKRALLYSVHMPTVERVVCELIRGEPHEGSCDVLRQSAVDPLTSPSGVLVRQRVNVARVVLDIQCRPEGRQRIVDYGQDRTVPILKQLLRRCGSQSADIASLTFRVTVDRTRMIAS